MKRIILITFLVFFSAALFSQNINSELNAAYNKAINFERIGNIQLAIFHYKQMLAAKEDHFLKKEARWRLGVLYKTIGELEQSFEYLKDILVNTENSYRFGEALKEVLDILKIRGGFDSNILYLDNLAKECPSKMPLLITEKIKMFSYYNRSDLAYSVIDEMIEKDPLNFVLNEEILAIIDEAQKRKEFIELLDKFHRMRRVRVDTYCLALEYFREFDKAAAVYENRLRSIPNDVQSLTRLIDIYEKSGKTEKAVKNMETLYGLSKENTAYARRLFKLYLESGVASADAFIRGFLTRPAQRNTSVQFLEDIIQLYDSNGFLEKGLEFVHFAENNLNMRNRLFSHKAMILLKMGKKDEAVEEYLKVSAINPDKLAEYLYQMFLSDAEIDGNVRSLLKRYIQVNSLGALKYISAGMKYLMLCGKVIEGLEFFSENSGEHVKNKDFLILTYIEPYFHDVRYTYAEKIKVIEYCMKNFSNIPTVEVIALFTKFCCECERNLDFQAVKTFMLISNLLEKNGNYILRDELRLQFYLTGADFFYTRIKDIGSAEKFYRKALQERGCTSAILSHVHCRLKEIDILTGRLNTSNMTDEVNKIPILYTKSDYIFGNVLYREGHLEASKNHFLKSISENLGDKVTNDALFKVFFIDKHMKSLTGEALKDYLEASRDFDMGNFKKFTASVNGGKISADDIPVKFKSGIIDSFENSRYESAIDTFKSILVAQDKSRYYAEKAQLEICRMGIAGKIDRNTLIIEFQTFLAFFDDSPFVDEVRGYLREYLKTDE